MFHGRTKNRTKQKETERMYLANLKSSCEFLDHHIPSTNRYIIAGIHARISWCNNRHLMAPVSVISSWIPHRETKRTLLDMAKHNRIRPLPFAVDSEKTRYQHARWCIWVQLTDATNKNCPVYTTQKSHNLDRMTKPSLQNVHNLWVTP